MMMLLACMDTWLMGMLKLLVQARKAMTVPSVMPPTPPTAMAAPASSTDGVADVAQLCGDGHDDVGEAVGLLGAVLQLVVQLAEAVQGLLLVGEDLDDLLALHHLFDVAVHLAQVLLLGDEVLAALLR